MLLAIYSIVYTFRVWVFWPGPSSPVSVGSSALVCFPSWRGPGYEHQWWASSGPRALSYLLRLQQVLTCLLGLEKTPFPLLVEWQQLVQGSWCSLCLWCVKASLCAKCSQDGLARLLIQLRAVLCECRADWAQQAVVAGQGLGACPARWGGARLISRRRCYFPGPPALETRLNTSCTGSWVTGGCHAALSPEERREAHCNQPKSTP